MDTSKTGKAKWRRALDPPIVRDHVNFSVPAPCTHADIVQRIAEELKLRLDPLPEMLTRHVLVRGPTIFGSAADVLDQITANYAKLYWKIEDGALRFEVRDLPTPVHRKGRSPRRMPLSEELTANLRDEEWLKKQKSLSQKDAAYSLGYDSDRTIRNLVKKGKLRLTPKKRVAIDSAFLSEYHLSHSVPK